VKDLAVVILNWNGVELLRKFLPSVIEHSGDARIIVADNASTDDSLNVLKTEFPEIELIINHDNFGFAKGYNEALKKIDAKYYMLLNSDVEVSESWLEPLYAKMSDPQVAGCQPKVLSFHEPNQFEHAGACGGFIDKNYFPFCRGRLFDHIEKDEQQYDSELEVFWASGAAMLVRADLFHEAGGFDEDFFAHMEEIDLCWRIKRMGYSFHAIPTSVIKHVGGGTLPYASSRKVYLNFRNNLIMIIKNHKGPVFFKLTWRMTLDGLAAIRFLTKGEFKNFGAVFSSHMYQYGHLRSLLKKRKEVKSHARVFDDTGIFKGSIIWNYYVKGVKSFNSLNQRLFTK
jgi:GT2 family glycosyltransferase